METTQITASYEEALLFVKNSVVEDGKKALDRCMKKSDEQVMKDISNTLDDLIEKEEN